MKGASWFDPASGRRITPIRLESEPIASLAPEGGQMPEPVAQGIANLVAIGLERARAQDLEHQVEAARHSERLRTALIDAMAHEFKTPLTSIKAAATSLLSDPGQAEGNRVELLRIADEEADRLQSLIDNAVDMGRLDTARIDLALEISDLGEVVGEVIGAMKTEMDSRRVDVFADSTVDAPRLDRRLVKLAIQQLLDNALKYSPPEAPVGVRISQARGTVRVDVTNSGGVIPLHEQARVFERFYRSPAVKDRIPGSGPGLSIAQAHGGGLTVTSGHGETTFRLTLPLRNEEETH
jgi:two-component system sensor histidine kinase KdpD